MNTSAIGKASAFAALSIAAVALMLALPSSGERAAANPASGLREAIQAGGIPSPKIAVIDTERIISGSRAGKAAFQALEQHSRQLEAEGRARREELQDLQAKLVAARQSGNTETVKTLEAALQAMETDVRRWQDDANREYTKKRDEALARIEATVMPMINAVAREGGCHLVFRKFESGLVYADDALDITNVVIARVDAATP